MRIAVVGAGVSGLHAAWRLSRDHDVTLYEANDYAGGHTATVDVEWQGRTYGVDTGFIVFNDWTYPNFIRLLDSLGVATQPSSMSFSVRDEASGISAQLEYPIKTMNVTRNPDHFQVDTGPVIVPIFESDAADPIARFAIAHVVYWTFDQAEFVLRVPHVVGEKDGQPVEVTDYSEIRVIAAKNEIWGDLS